MRSWGFGNGSVDPLRPSSQPGGGAAGGYIESDCGCLEAISQQHFMVLSKSEAA